MASQNLPIYLCGGYIQIQPDHTARQLPVVARNNYQFIIIIIIIISSLTPSLGSQHDYFYGCIMWQVLRLNKRYVGVFLEYTHFNLVVALDNSLENEHLLLLTYSIYYYFAEYRSCCYAKSGGDDEGGKETET